MLRYSEVPKGVEANLEYRSLLGRRALSNRRLQAGLREACKHDMLFWLNTFGWCYNTKKGGWDDWRVLPFISYAYQDELHEWISERIGRFDMAIVKSRQMGVTWWLCAEFCHRFQFWPRMAFGMVSSEERLVDGMPKSLFTKIDFLLKKQPEWLVPRYDHFHLRFINYENDSTIEGSTTTGSTFRGDNYTATAHDEMADRELVPGNKELAASHGATRSRIFFSTPQGASGAFYDVAHNEDIARKDLHWPVHPEYGKDKELVDGKWTSPWYRAECKRLLTPSAIAQELDLDFAGSKSPFFPVDLLERLLADTRPPVYRGTLIHRESKDVEFIEDRDGRFLLWLRLTASGRVVASDRFVVSCDVGAGVGATPSVLSVADRKTREKVAELSTNGLFPDKFAALSVGVCRFFNDAFLIWESNGMVGQVFGRGVLALGYKNIYYQREEKGIVGKLKTALIPGWHSMSEQFDGVMGEYLRALANGSFVNWSREAIAECRQYVYLPNGHIVNDHARGIADPATGGKNHGDRVVADALANKALGPEPEFEDKKPEAEQSIVPLDKQYFKAKDAHGVERVFEVPAAYTFAGRYKEYQDSQLPKTVWDSSRASLAGWESKEYDAARKESEGWD